MKRKRKLIAIVLSGLFLAYFSASFIFVPDAAGLKEQDTCIAKFERNDDGLTQGLLRSSTEQTEDDAVKSFNDFTTISYVESFHTLSQQNQYESLENLRFRPYDIYLSLRRLQV
jgi:hypothetical protein